MSITLNKNKSFETPSSPLKVEEYAPILIENEPGIASIVQEPDHCQQPKAPNATTSLKRTLSADMSSKKWLAQNGMKNIASFQRFSIQGEQHEFRGEREVENPSIFEVPFFQKSPRTRRWSHLMFILSSCKRSSISLSKKSLEICTESLGSETGSEGFPSYPSSETGNAEEKPKPQTEQGRVQVIANYNSSDAAAARATKKPRTFPLPIPSLQMHSHRESGRLVLEPITFSKLNDKMATFSSPSSIIKKHSLVIKKRTKCLINFNKKKKRMKQLS